MTQPSGTPVVVTVPVNAGATLRTGVCIPPPGTPDNAIESLPAGNYPAHKQCPGQPIEGDGPKNFWWVQITAGDKTGWVSAINVNEGGDNQPIPDVPQAPCVNV